MSSEPLTGEDWVGVEDDRLLTLDPASPGEPSIEPLLGPSKAARAKITPYTAGAELTGAERGAFAAACAAKRRVGSGEPVVRGLGEPPGGGRARRGVSRSGHGGAAAPRPRGRTAACSRP